MIRIPFVDGWTVGPKLGAFESATEDAGPQPVTLPHDAIRDLERSADSPQGVHAGYYPGGVFEYAKSFEVPEEWRDKTVALEFEGVYRHAVVYRGRRLRRARAERVRGLSPWGSTPSCAIGQTNRITVEARSHKDSRWYSGAGIYRPVHLVVADPLHIPLDGVRVTTPDIDGERAVVAVATTVRNDEPSHAHRADPSWTVLAPDGTEVAASTAPITVLPGESAVARTRVTVSAPAAVGTRHPRRCTRSSSRSPTIRAIVIDEDRTRLRHPPPPTGRAARPAHQRRGREAPRRVRAPRQRTRSAQRRSTRRRTGACACSRRPGSTRSEARTTRSAAPCSTPATATVCSSWTS